MLRSFAALRLAPNHSPHWERRVCWFSTGPTTPPPQGSQTPDLHPEQHPEAHDQQQEHSPEGADNRISQTQGSMRGRLGGTLEGQKEKPTLKSTIERLGKTSTKVHDLQKKFENAKALIKNKVRPTDQKNHLEILNANINFLTDGLFTLTAWKNGMSNVQQWESGNMIPEVFFNSVAPLFFAKKEGDAQANISETLEKFYLEHPSLKTEGWQGLNKSTRIFIASVVTDGIMEYVNSYIEKLQKAIDEQFDYVRSLERKNEEKKGGGWGIEFYSINEFVKLVTESSTNVIGAFKKAREEWLQLKIAGTSHALGKLTRHLPFGDDALQSLEGTLNHKDDEVKNHYVEHLEADLAPFHHMIDSSHGKGLLTKNMHDGNRFRGSLEYMAKKGWLYDVQRGDPEKGIPHKVMGYELIPGGTIPSTWSHTMLNEYITDLENKNQQGQESETKRGFARVDFAARIDDGIDIMIDELKSGNYWAVRGIFQRLLGKAKIGHTSAWLATTLMRHLRTDPLARRYFPVELFDRLGNESLVHLASTNFWWVADKFKLRKWGDATWDLDEDESDKRVEETETIPRITMQIEKRIRLTEEQHGISKEKRIKPPELDKLIARILASQVINSGRDKEPRYAIFQKISIFDDEFTWYRKAFKGTEGTSVDPNKTDDDFTREDSEIVMHGQNHASAILKVQSPDNLAYDAKALAYLGQLIRRDKQLAAAGLTKQQKNFRTETADVMKYIFANTWTADAVKRFTQLEHSEASGDGFKLLEGMIARKLINISDVQSIDTALAKALCAQVNGKKDMDGQQISVKHNSIKKQEAETCDKDTQKFASEAKNYYESAKQSAESAQESLNEAQESVQDMEEKVAAMDPAKSQAAREALDAAHAALQVATQANQQATDAAAGASTASGEATQHAKDSTASVSALDEVRAKELRGKAEQCSKSAAAAKKSADTAVKEVQKQKAIIDKHAQGVGKKAEEQERNAQEDAREQAKEQRRQAAEADRDRRFAQMLADAIRTGQVPPPQPGGTQPPSGGPGPGSPGPGGAAPQAEADDL